MLEVIVNILNKIEETGFFLNQLLVFLYLFLLLGITLLVEEIKNKNKLKSFFLFLNNLGCLSIISFLFLLITYYFVNIENTDKKSFVLLLVIPFFLLLTIMVFKDRFSLFVSLLIKSRLKLALPLLILSFIDHNFLSFNLENTLHQVLNSGKGMEELCFDRACYAIFLNFLFTFFKLSFLEQLSIIIPCSLGIIKLLSIPEINLLVFGPEEKKEFSNMTINPFILIKPLMDKIPPVKNSIDVLSQRTALSINLEGLNCPWKVEFSKRLYEGLEKQYKIIEYKDGSYQVINKNFSSLFECEGKRVIKIKESLINDWEEEKVYQILEYYFRLERELGRELTEKLMQKLFVLRNNKNAHEVYNLLFNEIIPFEEYKYHVLPKTNGIIGGMILNQGLGDSVSIISKDKANGLGELTNKKGGVIGYANSLPQDSSCAHTAQKLLETIHLSGDLTKGGIPKQGDFLIEEGGKEYWYEVKDLSYHNKINSPTEFADYFQDRVEEEMDGLKATMIYRGPLMNDEVAEVVYKNLQTVSTKTQKEILFFYKDQFISIRPEELLLP